jgi:hypothetical protein
LTPVVLALSALTTPPVIPVAETLVAVTFPITVWLAVNVLAALNWGTPGKHGSSKVPCAMDIESVEGTGGADAHIRAGGRAIHAINVA